jgi:WD40 repeat protein
MNARRSVPLIAASIAIILLGALAAPALVQEPAIIKPRASFPYSLPLLCMAVSPDGKTVAYSDRTGTHVWDVATGKRTATLLGTPGKDEGGALSLAYRPDGKVLAAGCVHRKGGEVRLFDLATGKFTQLKPFGGAVKALAFTGDGAFLATSAAYTDDTIWDTKTGKAVTTFRGPVRGGAGEWVAFSPQEKTLVVASRVRVEVWDRAIGKRLKWFEPQQQPFNTNSCRITPDGKTCFQGGSLSGKGLVRVWDVDTAKRRGTLEGLKGAVWSLALSSDGKVLATGGVDTVQLWHVDTLRCFGILEGHTGQVTSLAFSGDRRALASGCGFDRTLKVWDVPVPKRGK